MRTYLSWYKKAHRIVDEYIKSIRSKNIKTVERKLSTIQKTYLKLFGSYTKNLKNLNKKIHVHVRSLGENMISGAICVIGISIVVVLVSFDEIDHRQYEQDLNKTSAISSQSLDVGSLYAASVYRTIDVAFRYKDVDQQFEIVEVIDEELVAFEQDLYTMVEGHPIEEMIPFIAKQDRKVAALIVGIAKKESNWGKRSPLKNGEDCFNYWGYTGGGSRGKSLGYGCFEGPEEAIDIVGGRIHELAIDAQRGTPQEMIIWKCGNTCAGHSPESVNKWIQDVDIYYSRLIAIAK